MIWLPSTMVYWFWAVMLLAISSTTFYANVFGHQNYNVIGWMFFPLFLFGLLNGEWLWAGVFLLLSSFGSITVVAIASGLTVMLFVWSGNLELFSTLVFAWTKVAFQLLPLVKSEDGKRSLKGILAFIGFGSTKKAEYRRADSKKLGMPQFYYMALSLQYVLAFYFIFQEVPLLVCFGLLLYLINATIGRFADVQSMQLMMLSILTATTIQHFDYYLLPFYWLSISPIPFVAGFPSMREVFDVVPKLAPFSIHTLQTRMEKFLEIVNPQEKVLMAFNNPDYKYEKLFDGYRILLELPIYVATKGGFYFDPSFWLVHESQYKTCPGFWGRDVQSVTENVCAWNAKYVVIYQVGRKEIAKEWEEAGYKVVSKFDWSEQDDLMLGIRPYHGDPPVWWLLSLEQVD